MITSVTRKTTRRGDIWAVLTVEDLEASIEVLLFPKAYDQVATVLATDTVVKVKGRVKVDDDSGVAERLRAHPARHLRGAERAGGDLAAGGPVYAGRAGPAAGGARAHHPGMTEVRVRLLKPDGTLVARLPRHRVTPSPPLMADLKALLGPSCLASVTPARVVGVRRPRVSDLGAVAGVAWWAVVDCRRTWSARRRSGPRSASGG